MNALIERRKERKRLKNIEDIKELKFFFVLTLIATTLLFGIRFLEYQEAKEPKYATIVSKHIECGRSCHRYAIVNYKGQNQSVNLSSINYQELKEGYTYDFKPSFNWILGTGGTAYSVEDNDSSFNIFGYILLVLSLVFSFFCILKVTHIVDRYLDD